MAPLSHYLNTIHSLAVSSRLKPISVSSLLNKLPRLRSLRMEGDIDIEAIAHRMQLITE
jgi:hypothetical protein